MNYTKPTETSQTKNHPTSKVSLRSQFYQVKLACGTTYQLPDIEAADLSYVPCNYEQPILPFANLWDSSLQVNLDSYNDHSHRWFMDNMQGVQIMTGRPTFQYVDSKKHYLMIVDVEARLYDEYPKVAASIEQIFRDACQGEPFIVETKSGGRHYYAFCEYLDSKWEFLSCEGKMLCEFHSRKSLGRLDDRYSILSGCLLNIPSVPKASLQEIHAVLQDVATTKHHHSNDNPKVVERSQLGDLDIEWDHKGVSIPKYFPAAQCQATDHRDQSRKTVQFRKWDGGIKGHCYNCGESWWEVEPPDVPQPPPPDTDQPPAYRHFTKELRTVSTQVLGIPSTNGWQPRLEPLHSQPHIEPPSRRIYAPDEAVGCKKCGHPHAVPSIDRFTLTAHHFCQLCGHDAEISSYLKYELNRKLKNAIISDHAGYLADDPALAEESLWTKGKWFHLAAPMGTGKTTLIYHRAREAAETGAVTIIVVPRISLATAVFNQLREDTALGWGLFYEGNEREKPKSDKWRIGELGAVCTFGVLPHLIKKLKNENRPIRIFVDEVDFGASLLLASIFKSVGTEVKETLRTIIQGHGIVTAGQTASTLAIEAITAELRIESEHITGYYMPPRPVKQNASLYMVDTTTTDNTKNRLVQAVIDDVRDVLARGKNAYVLCDERRTAEIIHSFFGSQSLLYDRYHRNDPENGELLRLQHLSDGMRVFVASNAVDVGISIHDDNAETIVLSTGNPLTITPLASTAQKGVRNRSIPPLRIYFFDYQNALPLSPEQATAFQTAYAEQTLGTTDNGTMTVPDEPVPDSLVELIGVKEALETLAADQPADFLCHHLGQAGYELRLTNLNLGSFNFQQVQDRRKQIKDREDAETIRRAASILRPEQMLSDSEIRRRNWADSQPAPYNQLSHERAANILQHCGWSGEVERFEETTDGNRFGKGSVQVFRDAGVTEEMWQTARNAVHLNPEKIQSWKTGYMGVHYPNAIYAEYETGRQGEYYHRPDGRLIGMLTTELLKRLPRKCSTLEAIGQALINTAQVRYGNDTLSALMKAGSMGPAMAKRVRVIDLGRDAEPNETHFEFVKWFISAHYPARIAKVGDLYQLAAPRNKDDVEAFEEIVRCYIKHKHPDIDPDEPNNSDFTPPSAPDPTADIKELASDMRENGKSCRQVAVACGKSKSWVAKYVKSPPNPHPHWKVTSNGVSTQIPINSLLSRKRVDSYAEKEIKIAPEPAPALDSDIPVKRQILTLFESRDTSGLSTAKIVEQITVSERQVKRQLKTLVQAGELVKPRHGVYTLPNPVVVPESPSDLVILAAVKRALEAVYSCYVDLAGESRELLRSVVRLMRRHIDTDLEQFSGILSASNAAFVIALEYIQEAIPPPEPT